MRKRKRSGTGADHANEVTTVHANGIVSEAGASTSGGHNGHLDNNILNSVKQNTNHEFGVPNFPMKKKVSGKNSKKAKKVEREDVVQPPVSAMPIQTHGHNGSSSEHVANSNANNSMETVITENEIAGFIFLCSEKTKYDCYRYRVFGLPDVQFGVVEKIKKGAKLFLYDFSLKILHGIYSACSNGEKNLEADAFGGSFPAQVRFSIFKECIPLPEKVFKEAIRENYSGRKFGHQLNEEQVNKLSSLFVQIPPAPGRDLVPSSVVNQSLEPGIAPQNRFLPLDGHVQHGDLSLHQPYVAGVPPRRAGYQVVSLGQHLQPNSASAGIPSQLVEHHPLHLLGYGTSQHERHQRYISGLHEMVYRDPRIADDEFRHYPAAYGVEIRGANVDAAGIAYHHPAVHNRVYSHPYEVYPSQPTPGMNRTVAAPVQNSNYYPALPPWYRR